MAQQSVHVVLNRILPGYRPLYLSNATFPLSAKLCALRRELLLLSSHRTDNAEGETHASDSLL